LSFVFALFFLAPVFVLFYIAAKYDILGDPFLPMLIIFFLFTSFIGYFVLRKIFDHIIALSQALLETVVKNTETADLPICADELDGMEQSVHILEDEIIKTHKNIEKMTSQIWTLKELSDLCYVTFETEDLLHITLERALKITSSDIGSILILEQPHKEAFVVETTFGLGDILKKGDRIEFNTSIAKFAVINKSPLIIDDIEKDSRFGRENRLQYGTKAFLCMPLKGIHEVFGVLTLSRKHIDATYTTADAEILAPLLSTAAFAYDNISLAKDKDVTLWNLKLMENLIMLLNSSLRNSELLHALLNQIHEFIAFDMAVILVEDENVPDSLSILDFLAFTPIGLTKNRHYHYEGTSLDKVIKQESTLFVREDESGTQPLEHDLFALNHMKSMLFSPLRMGGRINGVLALGSLQTELLKNELDHVEASAQFISFALERNKLSSYATKRDREMETIKQIGSALASSTFDMEEVLKRTMEMIQAIMDVEAGSLLILEKDELHFKVAFNDKKEVEALKDLTVKLGKGISGYCAARGEPLVVRNMQEATQFDPTAFDAITGYQTHSVMCVPIISQGKVLGVIEVLNKRGAEFNDNDLHLLQSISTSLSIALENARLYGETLSMAEHERSIRNMFQKFVPKEIVDKIIYNSSAEKPVIEELKTLTLLNIDMRGFSIISKRFRPQRTLAILNYFFMVMGEIVFKHNGIVDKYLGDGFLAIFGAPISSVEDADNAVTAALEMQQTMKSINDYISKEIDVELTMGISIHTGEVVVGNIGFDKKMDYTVIGDSVNIVFRLQDLTKSMPNGILISDKSCQAVVEIPLDVREFGIYDAGETLGKLKIFELLGTKTRA
jgi:adenylate cyclase